MAESLGSAVLELSTTDAGFQRGVNAAEQQAQRLEKTFLQVSKNIENELQGLTSRPLPGLQRGLNQTERQAQGMGRTFTKTLADIEGRWGVLGTVLKNFVAGPLAAVGTAFTGLALLRTVQNIGQIGIAFERLDARFHAVTGNTEAANRELNFVRETAERLGLAFQPLAIGFTGIAAAADGTSLAGAGMRDVFTAVAEASAALQLSANDTQRIMLALQQVLSKGTLQAEEIRGQIGERLPGAFNIAARAMGVTTAELGKMLERGEVLAEDFLPRFARALRESAIVQQGLAVGTQTAAAQANRLSNAWEGLMASLARSGPLQAAAALMERLAAGLQQAPTLPRDLGAGASQAALNRVTTDLENQLKLLNQEMTQLQRRIDLATTVPTKNVEGLRGTFNFLESRAKDLQTQLDALNQVKEQAFAPPQLGTRPAIPPPLSREEQAARGGLSDAAVKILTDFQAKQQEIVRLSQAMGQSFDAADARAKLLRDTIAELIDPTKGRVAAESPIVRRLAGDLAAIEANEKAIATARRTSAAAEREARQALEAFIRDSNQRLVDLDRERAEEISRVFEQTRTPFERFQVELARLQDLQPHLPVDVFGRAVGQLANELGRADPALQAYAAAEERVAAITQSLLTPTERFNATVKELASLLTVIGPTFQQTFDRGVGQAVETFNQATTAAGAFEGVLDRVVVSMSSGFADAVVAGEGLSTMFQRLAEDVAKMVIQLLLVQAIFQGLNFAFPGLNLGRLRRAQHGLDFTVGGSGGIDSQPVAFLATPGERVIVEPPSGRSAAMGGMEVHIHNNTGAQVTAQQSRSANGQPRLDVQIDQVTSAAGGRPGSHLSQLIRRHGGSPPLIGR